MTAVVLAVVVISEVGGPGPLDDPKQADQRPGFLIDADEARSVRRLRLPGLPVGRRPVFLAFDRRSPGPASVRSAVDRVPDAYTTFLILPDAGAAAGAVPTISDPDGRTAQAVGIAQPEDGGAPVGYAVVDDRGRVRYATIDPGWPDHLDEIELITEAAR